MIVQGKTKWCKIVGAPGWGYQKQHKEWSFDFSPNEASKQALLDAGMDASYMKNDNDERGDYITFRRRDTKKDGTPGKPIAVFDRKGAEWDGKTLIGNGSVLNVKIALNEAGKKGTKPGCIKVQVWDLVPYEGGAGGDDDFPVDSSGKEEWA